MTTGWHFDSETLLPVLDDEHVFRAANPEDPAIGALVALFSGRPAHAERALRELIDRQPDSHRLRALLADARRDQGDFVEAEAIYNELLSGDLHPLMRASLSQHFGKTLFVSGRYAEAADRFAQALRWRSDHGAGADLVASSRSALTAARQRAAECEA